MTTIEQKLKGWGLGLSLAVMGITSPVAALPPPEDTPEAVLRTKIILDARSSIDGKPLTAAESANLQAALAESPYPPQLSPEVQNVIFLLQIRQMLQILTPF
ncbi:hypothetical protein [Dactylococcopsis salina]|uniref:Glutathione S-transferase n=1 Tax=Dactylococcopsis salina (strain PCC 8305) TaxID=13035 RepID=K9YVP6_DACS8|nr:hypothetical protein [Dactylococcopsis salina]AFZ50969.1 hypothetical protein Dacsa_2359 [Dactylococcopsis salina PCC 8305]